MSLVIPSPVLSGPQPWIFAAEGDSSKNAINHSAETTAPSGKLLAGNGLVERASPAEKGAVEQWEKWQNPQVAESKHVRRLEGAA